MIKQVGSMIRRDILKIDQLTDEYPTPDALKLKILKKISLNLLNIS